MVICTFLDAFDLKGKTIIPFFTYDATTYLNESMQKFTGLRLIPVTFRQPFQKTLIQEILQLPDAPMTRESTCRAAPQASKHG